jgi:hypothetical protein
MLFITTTKCTINIRTVSFYVILDNVVIYTDVIFTVYLLFAIKSINKALYVH